MRMIGKLAATLAASAITCLLCVPAHADVMYSDYNGTIVDIVKNGGLTVYGSSIPAMEFSPTITGTVSEIDVALQNWFGTDAAIVSLFTVNSSDAPGTLLGSWSVAPPVTTTTKALQSITGISGIVLTASTDYYLEVAPGDSTSYDVWLQNALQIDGNSYENGVVAPTTLGAFSVEGSVEASPVPEPAAWSLLAVGMAGLGFCRRRNPSRIGGALLRNRHAS